MLNSVFINQKINYFKKKINISGDKSLSIRWALIASQALGKSRAYNLLKSEDVLSTLDCLKKLGTEIKIKKNFCEINGMGLNSFKPNDSALSTSIMEAKFGHKTGWLSHETKNYKSVGLNTLGCWSDWKQVRQSETPIPYTRRCNFMSTYAKNYVAQKRRRDYYAENGAIFVFDTEFEQFCGTCQTTGRNERRPIPFGTFFRQ